MVVACLALAIALSGVGYAAVALPRNSVGTAQLKNNAVNAAKVKDGSLNAADFAAGQIPAGPKGDKGDTGATGERGPQGERGPEGPPNPNAVNAQNADKLDGIDSAVFGTTRTYAATEFQPFDPKDVTVDYLTGSKVFVSEDNNSSTAQIAKYLDLPEGTKVTAIRFWYVKNTETPILFRLSSFAVDTGNFVSHGSLTTPSGVSANVQAADVPVPSAGVVVNNSQQRYQLEFFPGFGTPLPAEAERNKLQLVGARVTYELPRA